MKKPETTPQSHYDEQRERFGARTTITDSQPTKCAHKRLKRVTANDVECKDCRAGWRFETIPQEILNRIENIA